MSRTRKKSNGRITKNCSSIVCRWNLMFEFKENWEEKKEKIIKEKNR